MYFFRVCFVTFICLPVLAVLSLGGGLFGGAIGMMFGAAEIWLIGWHKIRQFIERESMADSAKRRRPDSCTIPWRFDSVVYPNPQSGESAPWI